jgi:hypothetical protein
MNTISIFKYIRLLLVSEQDSGVLVTAYSTAPDEIGQTIDTAHLHSAYASLDGGFKLETLPDGRTRLIGESHYLLNLAPATYWNLWTKEIVHSVQRRVLEHVKNQAESGPKA